MLPEWVPWSCAANVFQLFIILALAGWLRSEHGKRLDAEDILGTKIGQIGRIVKGGRK